MKAMQNTSCTYPATMLRLAEKAGKEDSDRQAKEGKHK